MQYTAHFATVYMQDTAYVKGEMPISLQFSLKSSGFTPSLVHYSRDLVVYTDDIPCLAYLFSFLKNTNRLSTPEGNLSFLDISLIPKYPFHLKVISQV